MAGNIALGIKEVQHEHSGDESDDDVDDVVEQSPCGRWEKRRQEVIVKLSLFWLGGAHTSVSKFLWPFRFKVKRPNVKQKQQCYRKSKKEVPQYVMSLFDQARGQDIDQG